MKREALHDLLWFMAVAEERSFTKAAARLGVRDPSALPGGEEIRAALMDRRRLFQPEAGAALLHRQRAAALEAMVFFEEFHPRLVGPGARWQRR